MKKRAFFGEHAFAVSVLFTVLSGAETALGQQEREMDAWKADPSDLSLAVTQLAPADGGASRSHRQRANIR